MVGGGDPGGHFNPSDSQAIRDMTEREPALASFEHHAGKIAAGTEEVLLRVCPALYAATQVNSTPSRDNIVQTAGSRMPAGEDDQG